MKTYLITGCAGFIGSNFVHYMLKKYPEILLVNLDKLTYAGNLENLKDVEGDPRHVFVQGDICDKELVESLFAKYDFDYVINFAAESHVDRSIKNPEIFVQSNVMGTVNLLQRAKEAWYDADAKTWKEGKKYLQVSTDEVYGALGADGFFMETTPLCPHSPYSSSKASADMFVMDDRADLNSSEHGIGGVRGTKEALRWAFDKAEPGEVSGLYECGESDHMMVVGLVSIKPEGYRSLKSVQDQLRAEIVKDKKAEKIMADMKSANATSFDQYKSMTNAVSDSLKMVTFAAPAYVSALRSSEPLVGAYASVAEMNKLSTPIKGNAGVFVLQVYGKDKLNETFDAKTEEATLANMHARFASRLMNDLYLKANVKDTRFLFF